MNSPIELTEGGVSISVRPGALLASLASKDLVIAALNQDLSRTRAELEAATTELAELKAASEPSSAESPEQ